MGNNLMQKKQHKVFGIIAYSAQDNMYLLTQNKQGNFWEFPKGYPENQDKGDELKTALREFEEETGIQSSYLNIINNGEDLSFNYLRHGKQDKVAKYFLGIINKKPDNIKIQHSEVIDYKWASYNDALNILTYDNCKNILVKANSIIQNQIENQKQQKEKIDN